MRLPQKRLILWRKWINRSKAFNARDLKEMEDLLWDKMEALMETEHLTEDQAFLKAVESFGSKSDLIEVTTALRKEELQKRRSFILQSLLTLALLFVFLFLLSRSYSPSPSKYH